MFKEISKLFNSDDLLSHALDTCYEMLDIDLEMFKESKKSLRELDTADIPIDIYAMDQKINHFEREVRRDVMTHLTVSGTQDISSGLVMVSVVIDIERIGDYTKNIYDLAVNHPNRLDAKSFESILQEIEASTLGLLTDTIVAFKNQDDELAGQIMKNYKTEISSKCDQITNKIISSPSNELDTASATSVALYSRYLKRISAHCRNLTSSIVNPFDRIGYPQKKNN